MTGFAREAGVTGPFSWAWELKTVNGRGLEIRLRVPPGFEAAGEVARQALAAKLSRGQCQLGLTVARAETTGRLRVNRELLQTLIDTVGQLSLPADIRTASLDGLLAVRGVVETEEAGIEPRPELMADLGAAASRLALAVVAARAGEGASLATALGRQIDTIAQLVRDAEACPARQPDAVRKRLADQVAALLEGNVPLDPARLHQEAALLAARADIREELDRLDAHIENARELLAAAEPVGRRLDFLAQEFGRESNTLCAKAGDATLSRIGLDLKAVVDQFREQVQNVE